ncbi:type VII secretion protein EsaA [Enterococcus faecalis]|nr:type VII secretion protein EsaA [Enterococcus faecalis]
MKNKQALADIHKLKQKKRIIITFSILIVMLVFLIGLLFLLNQKKSQGKVQAKKATIALVNEDKTSTFNEKDYNFGRDFVNLVSGDTKYNWQVVSRPVADRAYSDSSVDAVIYIPQSFSHDILTLQDIDPMQAKVNYKLQENQSTLSQKLLDDKITDILYDFNQKIVKMYYASVAGNISEAQNNMNDVIKNQENVLTNLSKNVYGPFQSTNQGYSSVISSANGLQSMNKAWIDSQNSFTKSTQSMLDNTSKSFESQLPIFQKYFDTQKRIADINVKNGNQGIEDQAENDQEVYFKQFDIAYNNTLNQLLNFSKKENDNESGVLKELKDQVQNYNVVITGVHDGLEEQINTLTENREKLLSLEKDLYQQFFAQSSLEMTEKNFDQFENYQNETNARQALAQKLNSSFGETDNFSSKGYIEKINNILNQLDWGNVENYKSLFDLMEKKGLDVSRYKNELDLISRYGRVSGASSAVVKFSDVPSETNQTFKKTLEIVVPAGKNYILQPIDGDDRVTFVSSSQSNDEACSIVNGNVVELHNKDHEVTTDDGTISSEENTEDAIYTIVYDVTLGQSTQATVSFGWGEDGNIETKTSTNFTLYPADTVSEYLGGDNFGEITQLLNNIDTASTLITWSYGAPNYNIEDMITNLSETPTMEDFEKLSKLSIYNRYGNMDLEQLKLRLSEEDIEKFKQSGHENIEKIVQSIKALNSILDKLSKNKEILNQNMPNDILNQNIIALENWYQSTLASITQQYDSWKKNDKQTLALKPWQAYSSNEKALYEDKQSSEELYKTLSELLTSTAKTAEDTARSAQMIKDNATEFKQMVETTEETKNSAEKLLKNTNDLLNTGEESFKQNQEYNTNFNKVLANTRDQKADKSQLLNFFAQPLNIENITQKNTSVAREFDWRWLIVLSIGVVLGILFTILFRVLPFRRLLKRK